MRADKPTSFRLPPQLKAELAEAATEKAVPFHAFVLSILDIWLSNRLRTKAKPDVGILGNTPTPQDDLKSP